MLSALPGQGVELVVNPGCDLESSRKAVALAEQYPFIYAAVGVHPEDCGGWQDSHVDELRRLAGASKVAAIGEIGLDYYWKDNAPRERQMEVFAAQLQLAKETGYPVCVHDRESHADVLALLKEYRPQGVVHCFS